MTQLEQLVTEWRDAREAILLVDWGHPTVDPARKALWTRLGHAEVALMAHARQMTDPWPRSDADIREAIDTGGGQTCDVEGVLKALATAGFEIVRSQKPPAPMTRRSPIAGGDEG